MIKDMQSPHGSEVLEIYRQGIESGHATFTSTVPSWNDWDLSHLKTPRLVYAIDDVVFGWAALSPVSSRCVYAGVAEVSIYIAASQRGRGLGRILLSALIERSEALNIWTLQSGIFPENTASIKVHESTGFRLVGRRERLGQMNGQWRDILLFERRMK